MAYEYDQLGNVIGEYESEEERRRREAANQPVKQTTVYNPDGTQEVTIKGTPEALSPVNPNTPTLYAPGENAAADQFASQAAATQIPTMPAMAAPVAAPVAPVAAPVAPVAALAPVAPDAAPVAPVVVPTTATEVRIVTGTRCAKDHTGILVIQLLWGH